jgi:sn-glycerol 3-phosphate transport system ATP-binding protein
VEQEDAPDALYSEPRSLFAARFVGSPPMNVFEGAVRGGRFEGAVTWPVEGPDGPAALGVRPEDLALGEGPWVGTVDLVEHLGPERYVHVRIGDTMVVVRAGREGVETRGAEVRLAPRRVHLFRDGTRASGSR